ncbi:MAG: protein-disulfide reductase DsbD family protein [Methylovulum sp.]
MKTLILTSLLLLAGLTTCWAETPSVVTHITAIKPGEWPAHFTVSVEVPAEHHAYLTSGLHNTYIPVAFDTKATLATAGLVIKHLTPPDGVYDTEMQAQVLRGRGDFIISLEQQSPASLSSNSVALSLRYQLCNEVNNVCFRPQTTLLTLPLQATALPITTTEPNNDASVMDTLVGLFHNNKDNTLVMFGLMFLAGLLSVATPCVYPMLPITSMFIINRAKGVAKKEKHHAIAYLIGIIGTYMLLGLLAGMTGGAFNTFMQSAWVNLAFAVFFAFFAVALLGFYELAFMQNEVHSLDQHSARVNGLAGTWLMGMVAGLVISPCVGPIVFALLLQVADTIADKAASLAALHQELSFWGRFSIAASGSVMMAGFGVGVGVPFFIVSVVKFKHLPKAGYWMNKVKYAFGFMILYFAYSYFDKGMGVLGANSTTTLSLAIGMASIWIAVVHCNVLTLLPDNTSPNHKMHHYCGVMTLLIGGWLTVTGLEQLPFVTHAVASTTAPATLQSIRAPLESEEEAGITWHRSYEAAQHLAQQSGKPLFIDFYASWCANCKAFKEETANNKELNDALRNLAVVVKLVDKEPEFERFREEPEHRQLKIGLPYFAIIASNGTLLWSGTDYKASKKMVSVLTNNQAPLTKG